MSDLPSGSGPLADRDIVTGGAIDDPTLGDRANPRWDDPTSPQPDAQPLGNPDGSPDVMPPQTLPGGTDDPPGGEGGTLQDQAAQVLSEGAEPGIDNIREGKGDGVSNPALAEGGDNG